MNRIVVVDEEPRLCMLYEEVLSALGHEVYFAENGTEAWELFRESRPDVVIMDLDMSDGRPLETLKKIRSLDPDVPIFVSSIRPSAGKNPALSAIGVAGVFTKPIDIGILRLRLERALKRDTARSAS